MHECAYSLGVTTEWVRRAIADGVTAVQAQNAHVPGTIALAFFTHRFTAEWDDMIAANDGRRSSSSDDHH